MYREEIQQRFANAGWRIDGGLSDYLVIGYYGEGLSLLSHEEAWKPVPIRASNSSITRGTSPAGSGRYPPPARRPAPSRARRTLTGGVVRTLEEEGKDAQQQD